MKVLLATAETLRPDERDGAIEGELVRIAIHVCPKHEGRYFEGLSSRRLTPTAIVAERSDLTPKRYRKLLWNHLRDCVTDPGDPRVLRYNDLEAKFLLELAGDAPLGMVFRRDDEEVYPVWLRLADA